MMRTGGRIAAITVVVLLASSCGGDPAVNSGPLGDGGSPGGICVHIRPGQVESWGLTELVNTGHSNAVIETTRLDSAQHLRIVDAYVVPIAGSQEYGSWFGYPPAPYQRGVEWARHTWAKGARVPPRSGSKHADLLVVLQPTGPVAKAQGITVLYRDGGTQYELRTHYRFVLLVAKKTCPIGWPAKYPA
ncbi:MAG TPA: hypothetical protein VGG25_08930 [Streptosporangiaceae bacterium]|jgi:hypothetical protein